MSSFQLACGMGTIISISGLSPLLLLKFDTLAESRSEELKLWAEGRDWLKINWIRMMKSALEGLLSCWVRYVPPTTLYGAKNVILASKSNEFNINGT